MDQHRSWTEIDLQAIEHNVRVLRSRVAKGVKIVAVLKANAYGHGLTAIAAGLASQVDAIGIANVSEALEIKAAGVTHLPFLILSPALPSERTTIASHRFIPTVSTADEATAYAKVTAGATPLPIHFAFDTGMGRIGLWEEEAAQELGRILRLKTLVIVALSSHLPVSDEDPDYTGAQLASFARQLRKLFPAGVPATILNSAGALGWPQSARPGDLVRVGLALYGIAPLPEFQKRLRPAMTWKTRVTLVRAIGSGRSISYGRTFISHRAMRVATLAVGYGDGYQRHLSGRGAVVLIRGCRCPLLGRVTMDQIVVDVSEAGSVEPGEEVVLIGVQGSESILASELANKAGTIPWEVFTAITERVVRVYM
jgi:alanine racemase